MGNREIVAIYHRDIKKVVIRKENNKKEGQKKTKKRIWMYMPDRREQSETADIMVITRCVCMYVCIRRKWFELMTNEQEIRITTSFWKKPDHFGHNRKKDCEWEWIRHLIVFSLLFRFLWRPLTIIINTMHKHVYEFWMEISTRFLVFLSNEKIWKIVRNYPR